MGIYIIYKPIGLTPNQIIDYLKKKLKKNKLSFCGRLDPMASGLMMVLSDDTIKLQDNYLTFDKIYRFDLILGVSTDTYDILGISSKPTIKDLTYIENIIIKFNEIKEKFIDDFEQEYPPYSSIHVRHQKYGRQALWWYAKNNKLNEINIPSKTVNIKSFKNTDFELINFKDFYDIIKERLSLLKDTSNNFRQDEIMKHWLYLSELYPNYKIIRINCELNVSSGCYIRSIANSIGNILKTGGLALDITRIKLGDYDCENISLD